MKTIKNILLAVMCMCIASSAFAYRFVEIPTEESRAAHERVVGELYKMLETWKYKEVMPFFNSIPSCDKFQGTISTEEYPTYCKDGADFEDWSVTKIRPLSVTVRDANGQTETRNLPVISLVVVFDWALRVQYRNSLKDPSILGNAPYADRLTSLDFFKKHYIGTQLHAYASDCILERWFYSDKPDGANAYDTVDLALQFGKKRHTYPNIYPKLSKYISLNYASLTQPGFAAKYLNTVKEHGNKAGDVMPYRYISHHIIHAMLKPSDRSLEAVVNTLSKEAFWTAVWDFYKPDNISEMKGDAKKLAERCNGLKGCEEYKKLAEKYGLLEISEKNFLQEFGKAIEVSSPHGMPTLHELIFK